MPTDIEWSDETWNPVRGCSRVSTGCDHCYAMGQAHRFAGKGKPYHGLTVYRPNGARRGVDWSGRVLFVPEMLSAPRRWKRPRRIFVNSMSDLFHESLDNEQIAAVFGAMASAPHHTFQLLTKRPARMREWFTWLEKAAADHRYARIAYCLRAEGDLSGRPPWVDERLRELIQHDAGWPLHNVQLGISAENQDTYDARKDFVHGIPAARKIVSLEPLLGPINLRGTGRLHLDWVIVGGESGPGARPCDALWILDIVLQCLESGIACFVKQLGAQPCCSNVNGLEWPAGTTFDGDMLETAAGATIWLNDKKGGEPNEWPPELRVREFPA